MYPHRSWFKWMVLLSLAILCGMPAGCSDDDSSAPPVSTESLRIYEMIAGEGSFTAVAGDDTATAFVLRIGNLSDILYFTNRGAEEAGYVAVDDLVNDIWPRVYGTDSPNAIMKATTPDQETTALFCSLSNPAYDEATGQLEFTLTYLDGERPVDNLALADVKMIIVNNAAEVQPQVWSTLMAGDVGMLEPTGAAGVYTLYMEGVIEDLFDFTCAPHRHARTIMIQDYIQSWETRYGDDPPNATLLYNPPDNPDGGVQVVVLTEPIYDEDTDRISFRAERLFGTAPIGPAGLTVNNPSLFIDGGDGGFPTYDGNHFSIQYRNSTQDAVTVWLDGSQPPCSQAEAKNCNAGTDPAKYSDAWKNMKDAFTRSGTQFYIHKPDGTNIGMDVANHIDLQKGETLRIVPPIVNSIPEWYYYHPVAKKVMTAGVASWVTQKGISMPAVMNITKLEYNLSVPIDKNIWFDISAVDGLNVQATMSLEGAGCGKDVNCYCDHTLPKVCKTSFDAYAIDQATGKSNDGCPYIMEFDKAKTCPNPKFYPEAFEKTAKPSWVTSPSKYTTEKVSSTCPDIWATAGKPSGKDMCSAASGLASVKPAYHIWWSTNPVGQGWLTYLQKNAKGKCDSYGWAYDEKRWKEGTDTCKSFDKNGNPPDNKDVGALVACTWKENTYLNIDILKLMK